MTWRHGQSTQHVSLEQLCIFWINYPIKFYTEADREATELITKGEKNTFPVAQYARSQNQIDLPNQAVKRLHPLLKLPRHGHSSVLRTKIPKARTAIQQMQVTKAGRIPPPLLEFHLWNMTVISKFVITRIKQKAHFTIAHDSIGIFSVRINGKSINKTFATLHSCLMHCRGKGEYIWSVFPFLTFFFSQKARVLDIRLDRYTRTNRLKVWKSKCMVHSISAALSQCKLLLNISQINSFVEKWMQDWLLMASASQRT